MQKGLLELSGAPSDKPSKYRPISTQKFFSGLFTNRSPFGGPDTRYNSMFLGGRPDMLIDGSNVELTNYGTWIRRPGSAAFSTATVSGTILNFYSFQKLDTTIIVLVDTSTGVYWIDATSATLIFTKTAGAGQTTFQSVGNVLFMGNGVDQKRWTGVTAVWQGTTVYALGVQIVDPAGDIQEVTTGGTSDGSAPSFNADTNGTTADGTVTWTNRGPSVSNWGIAAAVAAPTLAFADADNTWVALTVYALNSTVFDSNGNQQKATTGGTSAATEPTWNVNTGGTTNDGTVVWTNQGPIGLSPKTGYRYVFSYRSHTGDISTASPVSATTGPMISQNVSVTGARSTDQQVTTVRIFRNADGGGLYYFLTDINNPTAGTWNFVDTLPDTSLNTLIVAPLANSSDPPPAGLTNLSYHLQRVWGAVGNIVYYSAGPDATAGNGTTAFPPANTFTFPAKAHRLVPYPGGLLVFTGSHVYVLRGTSKATLYPQMFVVGLGVSSYNSVDYQGSDIFVYTSDRQFLNINPAGIGETGFALGDQFEANFNPTLVRIAMHIAGQDKAVYVSNGSTGWYRCNPNQPPEGGPAWSPFATVTGGISAIASIETTPGIKKLLYGQSTSVLARSTTLFRDNGTAYSAFLTLGSLVLAQPTQIAELESLTLELRNVGTLPAVAVLLEEISGSFETLTNSVNDPPLLAASSTVISKRFYITQSTKPVLCRHLQVKITFATENAKNELLTFSLSGALNLKE